MPSTASAHLRAPADGQPASAQPRSRGPPPQLGQRALAGRRGQIGDLCVPKTSSTSCDQAIFVDQGTDARLSSDAVLTEIDRLGWGWQRRGAGQGAVRPVLVVVDLVLAQDPPQMSLVPDEGSVRQLAAAS